MSGVGSTPELGSLGCGFTLDNRPHLGLVDMLFWSDEPIKKKSRRWVPAIQQIL